MRFLLNSIILFVAFFPIGFVLNDIYLILTNGKQYKSKK